MNSPGGGDEPMDVEGTPGVLNRSLREEYPPIVVEPLPPTENFEAGTGPRLMILNIVNENFKSYAGIQRLGPFHKNFSAIVGPNGSGKSNVIDSMLFVFGYRANKIRSKKIGVLIHSSERHQNIQTCTVTVNFQKIIDTGDGDNDFEVVPGSQFSVSRTASRDNSSYYSIDGRRCTYKDVAKLLRSSGIDLDHNRFLILQGEVEAIAMMKPKGQTEHDDGMLEFLEDIIGSNRFKEPIEKLSVRIEELNEKRANQLNRVKIVEKEKDELEGAKDEAIEYLTIENDKVKLEHKAYQKYVYDLTNQVEEATKKKEQAAEKMKESDEILKTIKEEKKEHSKVLKELLKKHDGFLKKQEELKEQFSEFEKRDVKTREDMKHATAQSKKLEKSKVAEEKKIEEYKRVPGESEKHIENLQKKLKSLEKDREKEEENLKQVMESLKTETQGLQAEKDEKEARLVDLKKKVNDTQSAYNLAKSELDLILSAQQNEQQKLSEAQRNLEKAKKEMGEKEKGFSGLQERIPATEEAMKKVQNDLNASLRHEQDLDEKMKNLRVNVGEARSNFHSARSQNKVLDALMREKQAGRLKGIYGRLGDLGAIDEKYDVAVSTACPQLDNVLVDNIDTAQKCVNFLKINNIGRCSFIALDKQAHFKQKCTSKIKTPEDVPRLFDLIRVNDESFLPAFYFVMRDTLVAKDLTQARRVAFGAQRYRCVTMQGQIIETSGAMSGGGGRPSRGRMGSRVAGEEVSPEQLADMEKNLSKMEKEIETTRNNKCQLEKTFGELKKELRHMKTSRDKFEMEMKSLHAKEDTLTKLIGELEVRVQETAPDKNKLKELETNVSKNKKEFDSATKVAGALEAEVKELHEQIMDYGGAKLKVIKSKLDMVNEGIDKITGQITKTTVGVNTAKRNLKKAEEKLTSLEQEMAENTENLAKLKEELKVLDKEAGEVVEKQKEIDDIIEQESGALNEKRQVVAKLDEREENLQKEMVALKHQVSDRESNLSSLTTKKKHWEDKISKLKLQKIDGIEDEVLKILEADELANLKLEDIGIQITHIEEKLHSLKPNMAAIAEYRKKEEAYLKRVAELDEVTDIRNQQRKNFDDLRKQRLDEFMTGFSLITNKLKEMYQMITLGGDAELELVDSLDPFSEGIVFSVRPPKKSWKNISNLSGGEKTLSSLALVFALHAYKPTPLYVMDEIDAALDFKNVSIVAHYIKERTKNAQFIIISLRNNCFELADRLIGIYKTYDCTKSVTLNPKAMVVPVLREVDQTS